MTHTLLSALSGAHMLQVRAHFPVHDPGTALLTNINLWFDFASGADMLVCPNDRTLQACCHKMYYSQGAQWLLSCPT